MNNSSCNRLLVSGLNISTSQEETDWSDFIEGRSSLYENSDFCDKVWTDLQELQQSNRNGGLHLKMNRSSEFAQPLISAREVICRLPILYALKSDQFFQTASLRSARRLNRRPLKIAAPAINECLYASFWPEETAPRPPFSFYTQRPFTELKCQPITLSLLVPTGDLLLSLSTPLRPCRVERLLTIEKVSKVRLGLGDRTGLKAASLIRLSEQGGTGLSEVCVAAADGYSPGEAAAVSRWDRVRQRLCRMLRRPQLMEKCRSSGELLRRRSEELTTEACAEEEEEEDDQLPPPMQEPTVMCRLRSVSAEAPPSVARQSFEVEDIRGERMDLRPRTAHSTKGLDTWQRLRSVLKVHDSCLVNYCGSETLTLLENLQRVEAGDEVGDASRILQVFMRDSEDPLIIVSSDARQTSRVLQMLTLCYIYKLHKILPLEIAGAIIEDSEVALNLTRNSTLFSRLGPRRRTTLAAAARLRIARQRSAPLGAADGEEDHSR